jgi:hypothetical protein
LDRRLDGTRSWSGYGVEEKNSQPLPGLEPPIIQPVAQRYTTELSRFFTPIAVYYNIAVQVFLVFFAVLFSWIRWTPSIFSVQCFSVFCSVTEIVAPLSLSAALLNFGSHEGSSSLIETWQKAGRAQ